MKILIGGFMHETITFSKKQTTLNEFKEGQFRKGMELYQHHKGVKNGIGGFIEVLEKNNIELICSLYASATPGGLVTREVYDSVLAQWEKDISENDNIDGILLNLHGAMVVEGITDPEGAMLKRLKEFTLHKIPIMAPLDFHANIGPNMIQFSDGLIGYKTYPHVDMFECGVEIAELMMQVLQKNVKPVMVFRNIPLVSPLLAQGTYKSPVKDLMDLAKKIETENNIISVSIVPGFGYADIPENGFSVIVITNNDEKLAYQKLNYICEKVWEIRSELNCNPLPVKEAVSLAIQSTNSKGPVILCDASDNPGGGGAGDGVAILKELILQKAPSAVISTIWDPQSVRLMHQKKIGETIQLNLGGKSSDHENTSLQITGKIEALCDGKYVNKGNFGKGAKINIGLTGVLNSNGIKIIIAEKRVQTLDREIIRFTGIQPEEQAIIVVKSTVHYRADFEPIASKIIEVNSPGLVVPDITKLTFQHIRRPCYPFDKEMQKG
jgi:microcystin degradation protein MlrC